MVEVVLEVSPFLSHQHYAPENHSNMTISVQIETQLALKQYLQGQSQLRLALHSAILEGKNMHEYKAFKSSIEKLGLG